VKRVRLLLACSLALLPLARAAAQDKVGATPYYPLAVGTTWTYKAGGNTFQMKVTRHEKVGGVMCARIEQIAGKKVMAFEHVGVTAETISRYSLDGKEIKPPVTFFKLPPQKDATWKVESKVDGQTIKGSFKMAEPVEVKVPAGTYKAWRSVGTDLEINGIKTNVTYYLAEGVGMVKQELDIAGSKIVIELEKYEAGKSGG
jgi:hypothetical protein